MKPFQLRDLIAVGIRLLAHDDLRLLEVHRRHVDLLGDVLDGEVRAQRLLEAHDLVVGQVLDLRRGHAVGGVAAQPLQLPNRRHHVRVVDAVHVALVHAQALERLLELLHHGAAAALADGDGARGHRRLVGEDDLLELRRRDVALGDAQILLQRLDRHQRIGGVIAVDAGAVVAQIAQAHLQFGHVLAHLAVAQRVRRDAHELLIADAVLLAEGGYVEQRAQLLVLLVALEDAHARARQAVLGDEVGVLQAQADAAVRGRHAEVVHGVLYDRALVALVVGKGMEEIGVVDLRGIPHPAVLVGHVVPLGALVVALLRRHVPGARGRVILQPCGAEHLPGDGAVAGVVDRHRLVGEIHINVVGHIVICERGLDAHAAPGDRERQRRDQKSLQAHTDLPLVPIFFAIISQFG